MSVTRRSILKGAAVFMAAGTLAGCGSDDADTIIVSGASGSGGEITIPADEKVYAGAMGNNCGGRCMVKAHVRNGVIKRFSSDERPDLGYYGSDNVSPQLRACLRCRGKRTLMYRNDRMIYPLKQTLERGNPEGFVRISWKEAFEEIAEKFRDVINESYTGTDPYFSLPANSSRWGKATITRSPGSGPTLSLPSSMGAIPMAFMRTLGNNTDVRTSAPSIVEMRVKCGSIMVIGIPISLA